MEVDRSQKPIRAVLPSVLDLSESDDLLATLRELHASEELYAIDASGVIRSSTPCLQILLAALRSKPGVNLVGPSLPLLTAIDDVGLSKHFEERIVLE